MSDINGVLIGALGMVIFGGLFWVAGKVRHLMAESQKRQVEMTEALKGLTTTVAVLKEVADKFSLLPKYAEGNAKVAAANVVQITRLTKAVERFADLVVPRKASNGLDQYTVAAEAGGDREFVIGQILANNPEMDRNMAIEMAQSEMLQETVGAIPKGFGLE